MDESKIFIFTMQTMWLWEFRMSAIDMKILFYSENKQICK